MYSRFIILAVGTYTFFAIAFSGFIAAQETDVKFPEPPHQVMILGTFHFKDAGLDDYKPKTIVDFKDKDRQAELEKVLNLLAEFKPTKIAVEAKPDRQKQLDEEFKQYLAGDFQLGTNEIYLVGFQLAKRLGHSGVFAIDAPRRRYDPYVDPDEFAKNNGQTDLLQSKWWDFYEKQMKYEDQLKGQTTLGEYLQYLNRADRTNQEHGVYLIDWFKAGKHPDYVGADLQTSWYNRNLRIYSNIARLPDRKNERVLVIVGAGHLPLLRHCVDCSPEFELVNANTYLKPSVARGFDAKSLVEKHSFELTHNERLGGAGMDLIVDSTKQAQFVMIAEPHNTDQVNQFTRMLFERLNQRGFQHLIVEQGPQIMQAFTSANVRGDLDAIRSVAASHPEALHFGTDEELKLLAAVGKLSKAQSPIWGVDRIHDASLAFKLLAEEFPTHKKRFVELIPLAREQGTKFLGKPNDQLDELLDSLNVKPESPVASTLHALIESRKDFIDWNKEHSTDEPWGYGANKRREDLMKAQFVAQYRQAQSAQLARAAQSTKPAGTSLPKAIAKMGHWHLIRGYNPGSVVTLGNLLVDAAKMNGQETLSIAIQPVNEPGRDWSITDDAEFAPLTVSADPAKWIIVDLRKLRPYVHAGLLKVSPEVSKVIFGFDLLLLIGGTDPGQITWLPDE